MGGVLLLLLLLLLAAACGGGGDGGPRPVEHLVATVLAEHPHDPTAFTQGLEIVDGVLWESTGLRGESTLRAVDRTSGRLLGSVALEPDLFGEGLTALGDGRLLQLTWTAGRALVWEAGTLLVVDEWDYDGQGWGACRLDDATVVVSDGSTRLTLRGTDDFAVASVVEVHLDGEPVDDLNELECVDGTVWANVWHTDLVVGIDPATGQVTTVVDASGLPVDRRGLGNEDVLNGIAHDPATGRFLLTGKRWPVLFEVEFVAEDGAGD
mgnify:CR=1 FL=1